MLSNLILILMLLSAVGGLICFLHREAHRDCACSCSEDACGACALAKSCKRATIVGIAALVALTTSGINIEHHCHHCAEAHHSLLAEHTGHAGHDDHCTCCDHCAHCFFIHLSLDQYDQPEACTLPAPDACLLPVSGSLTSQDLNPGEADIAPAISPHAPPLSGVQWLHQIEKLTI